MAHTSTLERLPVEITQDIQSYLNKPSTYLLRLTCRHFYYNVDLTRHALNRCQRWQISTVLEAALPDNHNPPKLTCDLCKCKRPLRDFGLEHPGIVGAAYSALKRIPVLSRIVDLLPPSLHCYNYHVMSQTSDEPLDGGDLIRYCYRHDHLFYTSWEDTYGKITPRIENPRNYMNDFARYLAFQVLCCGHCGRLMHEEENRVRGCESCNCEVCVNDVRMQSFRLGDGGSPMPTVTQYVALQRGNPQVAVIGMRERGRK